MLILISIKDVLTVTDITSKEQGRRSDDPSLGLELVSAARRGGLGPFIQPNQLTSVSFHGLHAPNLTSWLWAFTAWPFSNNCVI